MIRIGWFRKKEDFVGVFSSVLWQCAHDLIVVTFYSHIAHYHQLTPSNIFTFSPILKLIHISNFVSASFQKVCKVQIRKKRFGLHSGLFCINLAHFSWVKNVKKRFWKGPKRLKNVSEKSKSEPKLLLPSTTLTISNLTKYPLLAWHYPEPVQSNPLWIEVRSDLLWPLREFLAF